MSDRWVLRPPSVSPTARPQPLVCPDPPCHTTRASALSSAYRLDPLPFGAAKGRARPALAARLHYSLHYGEAVLTPFPKHLHSDAGGSTVTILLQKALCLVPVPRPLGPDPVLFEGPGPHTSPPVSVRHLEVRQEVLRGRGSLGTPLVLRRPRSPKGRALRRSAGGPATLLQHRCSPGAPSGPAVGHQP